METRQRAPLWYQGTTSQFAEKLASFEGAQLQLCRKAVKPARL
jgi:hypothetical protein